MLAPGWFPPPLVLTVALTSVTLTTWQGQADNKSVATLFRLGTIGLVSEGRAACVAGAMARSSETDPIAEEATTYLQTLERVAQEREHSDPPTWVPQMIEAVARQDARACNAIWEKAVQTYLATLLYKAAKRLWPAPAHPL